jgi:DNA-binding XRE family transcriptional regulator
MPDPLCRLRGMAASRSLGENPGDTAGRLTPPHELERLSLMLGLTVRHLRSVARLSQEALGHRASMHRNYVGAFERGELNPTLRVIVQLAYALRVPVSDLFAIAEHLAEERRRDPAQRW